MTICLHNLGYRLWEDGFKDRYYKNKFDVDTEDIAFRHQVVSYTYSRLSLSRSRRDPLKHFEISVLRHIRFAELKKIPIEQPNFRNKHVI